MHSIPYFVVPRGGILLCHWYYEICRGVRVNGEKNILTQKRIRLNFNLHFTITHAKNLIMWFDRKQSKKIFLKNSFFRRSWSRDQIPVFEIFQDYCSQTQRKITKINNQSQFVSTTVVNTTCVDNLINSTG